MTTMSPETEERLLRAAGYSDSAIKIYKDLKTMPFNALDGQAMAEAFLLLLDEEKRKTSENGKS